MEKSERLHIISRKANEAAKWLAVALGFTIPISTSADSVLLVLILALWFLGANFRNKISLIKGNPFNLWPLILFGLYVVGLGYGTADKSSLTDTAHFLLIPLFITLFQETKIRLFALWGFLSALLLTLLLSYLLWFNLLPACTIWKGTSANPVIFHRHITHSLLMAFGAFLFSLHVLRPVSLSKRVMFALFAVLALVNVLFMVQGRTGQVVILILAVFFLWNRQRGRALVISAIAVILLLVSVAFLPSSSLHQRFARGFAEFSEWQPGTPSSKTSSVGLRMEFYKNTLEIIRENPIWGVGTGDFANAYAAQIKNTGMMPTENPHNEYLMITVQLGVIGLGFFLLLFFKQWHLSISIPDAFEKAAARGLVLTIMGASMVSSTLIDHTEGLFYFWMSALLYASLNSEIRSYKI